MLVTVFVKLKTTTKTKQKPKCSACTKVIGDYIPTNKHIYDKHITYFFLNILASFARLLDRTILFSHSVFHINYKKFMTQNSVYKMSLEFPSASKSKVARRL